MQVATVDYRSPHAARDFTRSLVETGFAVLKNHPISQELIREIFLDWENFFASDEKFQFKFDPQKQSGHFPFRSENAKDYSIKDLKEFFHVYPKTELPESTRDHTWRFFHDVTGLATELLKWLDIETPAAIRSHFSMPLGQMIEGSEETLLRPIHYPPMTGSEEEGAIRAAAHEDINLITLLPAATSPGLQVKDTHGNWHDVSCDPGSIAINAGDMLQMASRGYYPSTTHRVINPIGPESRLPRYSMPLFLHPRKDISLSEKYTAGSYLRERLEQIGLIKK